MHDLLPTSCTNLQKNCMQEERMQILGIGITCRETDNALLSLRRGKIGVIFVFNHFCQDIHKALEALLIYTITHFFMFFKSDSQQTRQPAGNYNLVLTSISLRCFTNSMSAVKSRMAIEQALRVACNIQS